MKSKVMKKLLLSILISFGILMCGDVVSYASTVDQITISNFSVSDSTPELGDVITFSFHVDAPEDKQIVDIQWSTTQGYGGRCGCATQFPGASSYDATVREKIIYYGTWTLEYISVTCADGTSAYFYSSDYCEEYGMDQDSLKDNEYIMDVSGFNATVENDPKDTTAPVLNDDNISLSKATANVNESVTVGFEITDDVSIAYAWPSIKLGNGGLCGYGNLIYNENTGLWETNIRTDYIGTYEFQYISIVDTSGNYTYIFNSEYSDIDNTHIYEDAVLADLSNANFKVESVNPNDHDGPQIDINTLNVKKKSIGFWEDNEITLKVTDESDIVQVDVTVKQGQWGECGTGFLYDSTRDLYVLNAQGQFYGTWELVSIGAVDVNGNRTTIYNSAYEEGYIPEDATLADMSIANFDVGIQDEDTDIFITGDGMDTDVTLDVSELETSDDDYEILIEDGYEKDTFVDIHVNGTYNKGKKKVKVRFKPKHGKNGDKIRIRHLLKDGRIQTHDAIIKDGYVYIMVDEFSPFLLERIVEDEESETNTSVHENHTYDTGVMKTLPTCVAAGEKIYTCTGCGQTKTEAVAATGTHTFTEWMETKAATGDVAGEKTRTCSVCGHQEKETIPAMGYVKGAEFSKGKNTYTIKSVKGKKGTVVYEGTEKASKKVSVPKTVKVDGKTYTVTEIADDAFKDNTKITSVTIPEGVTKIGKNAFSGCKKLKTITIKSTKLKTVGKNAIKGIDKKATIKVPSKQLSKYQKLFKSKIGYKKTMKIKK